MSEISHREFMLRAVFELVKNSTRPCWVRRNHPNTLDIKNFPAMVMFDGGADLQEGSPFIQRYTARFEVLLAVQCKDSDDLGWSLNELRASLLKAMARNPTLDGLVSLVQHVSDGDPEFPFGEGRAPEMQMTLGFIVEGEEIVGDPYRPEV